METRHEGQTGALPPADQDDVVGMPLRAIADLHGAYGAGVELDMRYVQRIVGALPAPGVWRVALETNDHGMMLSFFDQGRVLISVRTGAADMFAIDQEAYAYRGFMLAVEAVRVWLHRYGGKR